MKRMVAEIAGLYRNQKLMEGKPKLRGWTGSGKGVRTRRTERTRTLVKGTERAW